MRQRTGVHVMLTLGAAAFAVTTAPASAAPNAEAKNGDARNPFVLMRPCSVLDPAGLQWSGHGSPFRGRMGSDVYGGIFFGGGDTPFDVPDAGPAPTGGGDAPDAPGAPDRPDTPTPPSPRGDDVVTPPPGGGGTPPAGGPAIVTDPPMGPAAGPAGGDVPGPLAANDTPAPAAFAGGGNGGAPIVGLQDTPAAVTPEPGSLLLIGGGLGIVSLLRRRRRNSARA